MPQFGFEVTARRLASDLGVLYRRLIHEVCLVLPPSVDRGFRHPRTAGDGLDGQFGEPDLVKQVERGLNDPVIGAGITKTASTAGKSRYLLSRAGNTVTHEPSLTFHVSRKLLRIILESVSTKADRPRQMLKRGHTSGGRGLLTERHVPF